MNVSKLEMQITLNKVLNNNKICTIFFNTIFYLLNICKYFNN